AASHFARRESRRQRRVLESSGSVGTQLPAASLVEYSLQPDRHHSLHFVYGQRAVGGHHAHEARANKLGRGHQAGRGRCGTLFLDGAKSVAIRARGLRHARILWLLRLGIAVASALGTALMVTLVLPGGEPLYRSYRPDRMQLSKAFTLRGLRSKEFFSSAVVGLTLAAAHIGFIVAFYMVGSRYGVWAPQDLNYSDTVNTTFPWIAGVAIGLMASTSEEFLFRLFAIPFVERMTKSRILAVI